MFASLEIIILNKMRGRFNIYYLASLAAFCANRQTITRKDNLLAKRIGIEYK